MAIAKFEEIRLPYEFLVRWNNGMIQGAHIAFLDVVTKDGVIVSAIPTNPEPVQTASENGFPLETVLELIHINCLTDNEALRKENEALKNENTQFKNEVERLSELLKNQN